MGFKEVHLNTTAMALLENYGADISSMLVSNHLRKWRVTCLPISRLRDLTEARWCEETKCIISEAGHYHDHVSVSTMSSTIVLLNHWSLICTTNTLFSLIRITLGTTSLRKRTSPTMMRCKPFSCPASPRKICYGIR
jgi:hypothetical protein